MASPTSALPARPESDQLSSGDARRSSNRLWPRRTTGLLLLVGLLMGAIGFATVMAMPNLAWHGTRGLELQATYDAYRETGTLLVKESGSGSNSVQGPTNGPLTFATWDDDPGSYIIASLMSHVTGSESPYPGLTLAQALLVGIPLIWLPLAVARVVGRARAGFAMVLLPLAMWLFNHGATLAGTEYGLSDQISTLPVYSLYGTAASLAFLSLSLVVLASSFRLSTVALIAVTVGFAVLAASGNMSRSLSGMGVAAAVGVLWWIHVRGRWKWVAALGSIVATILLATVIQNGVMSAINGPRAEAANQQMSDVPDAHTAWHSLYLGLSYPQPLNGQESRFGVLWSDQFGWEKAQEVDPDVVVASTEYDEILKDLYFEKVLADPLGAVKLYVKKLIYVTQHFGGLLLFIIVGFSVGLTVRARPPVRIGRVLAIALPTVAIGLVPAVLVMPMLYYYSELAASLGVLAAVSLGIIVWAVSSWPARVRDRERQRTATRDPRSAETGTGTSIVIDAAGTASDARSSISSLGAEVDEIVVVVSTGTAVPIDLLDDARVRVVASRAAGVGGRLREGVLATAGARVAVLRSASDAGLLVIDPEGGRSAVVRSATGGGVVNALRRALLSLEGRGDVRALVLDGADARALADISREPGALWFEEMAFGAQRRTGELSVRTADTVGGTDTRLRATLPTIWKLGGIAVRAQEYGSAQMTRVSQTV
ncbi:hypothetical protein [Microbacterium sp. LB12]|uniref:hypothetical protein n=2 Tax=unclassified Microbacterium TaxID=2609290 RepID=UPI00301AED9C